MTSRVQTAIVLAAGEGTRLAGLAPSKPLCHVAGSALVDWALHGLAQAGIRRVIVVIGFRGEAVRAHLVAGNWPLFVETADADHRVANGVSTLAGAAHLAPDCEALLVMCDHLVDPELYARVASHGARDGLALGIDRRLGHPWIDPDDVTAVAASGERITAIGKALAPHDAYDTGVFAIGPRLPAALASLAHPSLTEGVRLLAAQARAFVVDVSDLGWIDVDDARAHAHAETWWSGRLNKPLRTDRRLAGLARRVSHEEAARRGSFETI